MAKPLRSQLNQIRAWVRQGRTDAWIAHQLEVSTTELSEFRRRHELSADDEDTGEADLRDEIEAEIEAAAREEELAAESADEAEDADETDDDEDDEDAGAGEDSDEDSSASGDAKRDGGRDQRDGEPRKRRRRRRGGRGGKRPGVGMQASFDHGDTDGYGLWLDPVVKDDPVYSEHWAGHRKVEVTVEPNRIVITRSEPGSNSDSSSDSDD